MSCLLGKNISVCRSDLKKEIIGRTNKRWCFKCLLHIIHNKVLYSEILRYTEKGDLINGYYDPFVRYECRNCHEEHLEFGG